VHLAARWRLRACGMSGRSPESRHEKRLMLADER
jgi:hypothetical protein